MYSFACSSSLCLALLVVDPEEDPDVFHQYHRFDLSRIPDGETVTAAEFRVYKDFVHERYENETFHVSVYQVLREQDGRYAGARFDSDLS